jgi:carboxylesterase
MAASLGVLILHGFTSSRSTVEAIVPRAETLGLPWRLPQLRGHWTKPEDLVGVTYSDMLADASAALVDLRREVERVAIAGLSVGGVLAINLAAERPADVAGLALIAPALRYAHPLAGVSALLQRFVRWSSNPVNAAFSDQSLVGRASNYQRFPTATFASIYRAGRQVEAMLPRVRAPLIVIGARQDRVVQPRCAQIVYEHSGSSQKDLAWFERSGHEMLLDCEADAVAEQVGVFLKKLTTGKAA